MLRRPKVSPELDPSTLSNYGDFIVHKTQLDLAVDFDKNRVSSCVSLNVTNRTNTHQVVLDKHSV